MKPQDIPQHLGRTVIYTAANHYRRKPKYIPALLVDVSEHSRARCQIDVLWNSGSALMRKRMPSVKCESIMPLHEFIAAKMKGEIK